MLAISAERYVPMLAPEKGRIADLKRGGGGTLETKPALRQSRRSARVQEIRAEGGGPRSGSGDESNGDGGTCSSMTGVRRQIGSGIASTDAIGGADSCVGGATADFVGGSSNPRLNRIGDGCVV